MKIFKGILSTIIFTTASAFVLFYYYQPDIILTLQDRWLGNRACQGPIAYSIADIDPRFGITEQELSAHLDKAEKIWEDPAGRQLFEYSPAGAMKISLIYDERQKATDELQKIGIVVQNNQATYEELKKRHEELVAAYKADKARLEAQIASFKEKKDDYDEDVSRLNRLGGGTKEEVRAFELRRTALNAQVAEINKDEEALNKSIDDIRSTELILNNLIKTLNLHIDAYNEIGSSTPKEFNEGLYVRDENGTFINIYQFNDKEQLVRVLAHELGHALDIEHIDNPKAIMYYLNEGMNDYLTEDDLAALKNICRIK